MTVSFGQVFFRYLHADVAAKHFVDPVLDQLIRIAELSQSLDPVAAIAELSAQDSSGKLVDIISCLRNIGGNLCDLIGRFCDGLDKVRNSFFHILNIGKSVAESLAELMNRRGDAHEPFRRRWRKYIGNSVFDCV